jgi:hypothetical protein
MWLSTVPPGGGSSTNGGPKATRSLIFSWYKIAYPREYTVNPRCVSAGEYVCNKVQYIVKHRFSCFVSRSWSFIWDAISKIRFVCSTETMNCDCNEFRSLRFLYLSHFFRTGTVMTRHRLEIILRYVHYHLEKFEILKWEKNLKRCDMSYTERSVPV